MPIIIISDVGTQASRTCLLTHSLNTGGELDELLSLDVGHAMHTGDTITDGQDATGLGQVVLLLNTADALLEDRAHLGR